jgi:pimeloyl-ACP methyl ester carboxylesterase
MKGVFLAYIVPMKSVLIKLAKIFGTGLLILVLLLALAYRPEIEVSKLLSKYTDEHSHFTTVDGVKLHVKVKGEGEPIFLIHGSFSSLHTWEAWEKEINPFFMTISMDLPGHGLTGPHPEKKYSVADYASLLFQLADKLEIEEFHVAGNSMGGAVALKMASDNPKRILSLNLIDSSGAPRDSEDNRSKKQSNNSGALIFKVAQNPVFNKLMLKCTPRALFKWNLKQVFYDHDKITDKDVNRYYELILREGNRRATLDRLTSRENLTIDFDMLNMPVLIMWGEEDQWIPLAHGKKLKTAIPGATIKVFEKAGHVPMEEIPTQTVEEYLKFLGIKVDLDYLSPPKFFSYVP